MLHSYIQSYVNKEINEFSTENILNLITKERQSCLLDNDMSGDNFTDNGQHDIFDLLRHFLNLVHPLFNNYLLIAHIILLNANVQI